MDNNSTNLAAWSLIFAGYAVGILAIGLLLNNSEERQLYKTIYQDIMECRKDSPKQEDIEQLCGSLPYRKF